jgi:Cu/Ag efflux protein CusF
MRLVPVCLLFLLSAECCLAQTTAYGILEELDRDIGTITVLLPPKYEAKQYNLSKADLPVSNALGGAVKLADLRDKQRVALLLDDAEDVAAIRVDDNCLWAYVIKVDVATRQLTVKYGHIQRSLPVPADAVMLHDGAKSALDTLKVGQGIKAVFAEQNRLVQIQTGKGISGVSPYHRWGHQSGVLLKIDHDKKTLQILTLQERFKIEDYEFQPDAILRLTHSSYLLRTTGIDELHAHCKLSFYYESDTKKIVQVSAMAPTIIRRKVDALDRAARRITIEVDGKPLQLSVPKDAMIRTPNGLANWEDVDQGALVTCGLTMDNREAVFLYLWEK